MLRAGGHLQLEQGVRAGRIIRSMVNNMQLFFFPRYQYSKEHLYKQTLQASIAAEGGGLEDVAKIQDEQFGYNWDPSSLIPSGLLGTSQPMPLQHSSPMSVLSQPMALMGSQPMSNTQPMSGGGSQPMTTSQPMSGSQPTQPMSMMGSQPLPMMGSQPMPMMGSQPLPTPSSMGGLPMVGGFMDTPVGGTGALHGILHMWSSMMFFVFNMFLSKSFSFGGIGGGTPLG